MTANVCAYPLFLYRQIGYIPHLSGHQKRKTRKSVHLIPETVSKESGIYKLDEVVIFGFNSS